ncbi:hypothetical protein [Sutcliffiella horikoshii]
MKYKSKVVYATVIIENEPDIVLLAKAVIMVAEDTMARKDEKNGEIRSSHLERD